MQQIGNKESGIIILFGLGEQFLCPDGSPAVAIGVHHACGIGGLPKAIQGLLMLLEGVLKETMLEIHSPQIVTELPFQLKNFCSLFATLHEDQGLRKTLCGFFRLALFTELQPLLIKVLGLIHPLLLGVTGGQRDADE